MVFVAPLVPKFLYLDFIIIIIILSVSLAMFRQRTISDFYPRTILMQRKEVSTLQKSVKEQHRLDNLYMLYLRSRYFSNQIYFFKY